MKFSTKLSFTILFTGILALIIFSFMIFKFSSNEVIKSQSTQTQSIAKEAAFDFDLLLSEKIKTALTLANTPILKNALETSNFFYTNLSDEKRKDSIKLLNEQWKSTKDPADKFIQKLTENKASHFLKNQQIVLKGEYGEIFLTNKFGALVASTSKLSTFAHGHKYWWLGSYNNGEGAVFFDDRGYDDSVDGYVLGLVVPIRKGKEVIGILKCNLNILGNISELIVGAGDTLIGKLKLIRSGGMVVFEEGFEPLSTQIHDDIYRKIKNKNNDLFILNDSGEKYLVGFSEVNLTKEKSEYGFGGTFESIDHKKGNTGESWYVLCSRQMSVVQAPIIESIKWGALTGILVILSLVLASCLFAKKITKPLLILDKATKKIGKGDFEYRIELKQKDEFGNLAHSFNKMADRLHHTTTSIELLEKEINDRKQAEKELELLNLRLEYEVSHDPLTGALSRRAILDSLSKELIRAKRRNTKLSIGLCDIDHFKHVNDKHGHQVGDDVLCSFVKATQNVLRPYDIVGRYGGEEFLLVVPDFKESSEKGIYERVRATIAEHKMITRSGDVSITISIGIASSSGDETADEILAKADAALYRAKENGRNQLAQNI